MTDLATRHGVGSVPTAGAADVHDERDLVRTLLAHLAAGTGGEHFVASTDVLLAFAGRFAGRATLGGTNLRAGLAMRALGRASTVHLVSTGAVTSALLPADLAVVTGAGEDTYDPHVVVQFTAGAEVRVGGRRVVAPAANRVIYVNDRPNRELIVAERFGDAAARADVVLVSGFNAVRDRATLTRRVADVRRHLARRRPGALAVYEHGAFHVGSLADVMRRELGPAVNVWSCNEDELQEQPGSAVDLGSPRQVLEAVRRTHATVGAGTLVVHTRSWALALGGDARARRAMLDGGTDLAAARYTHGDAVTPALLAEVVRRPRQPAGARFVAALEDLAPGEVTCRAAYDLDVGVPTTVGLGDAFVGGLVAALADRAAASAGP
ncbi:hypothetical protein GCM10022197_31490 [Microlunatus spumicola]|uniref:ADP-dependent phosphofructokinase/glucokinase n=1 Tax=Microlunatus spumicola TaxID=81499 RepID=A0ABP6XVD7_9ACTN